MLPLRSALKTYGVYDDILREFPDLDSLIEGVTFRISRALSRKCGVVKWKYRPVTRTLVSIEVVISADMFRPDMKEFLNDTLRHEVAHVLTGRLYGMDVALNEGNNGGHGRTWQAIAVRCGAKPQPCQNIPLDKLVACAKLGKVQRRMRVPKEIVCSSCGYSFGFSARNLKSNLIHRGCGGKIAKVG